MPQAPLKSAWMLAFPNYSYMLASPNTIVNGYLLRRLNSIFSTKHNKKGMAQYGNFYGRLVYAAGAVI